MSDASSPRDDVEAFEHEVRAPLPQAPAEFSEEAEGPGISDLLSSLLAHKWAMLITFVVMAAIGATVVLLWTPVYRCRAAVLQIVADGSRIPSIHDIFERRDVSRPYFETQVSLVTLAPVIQAARKRVPEADHLTFEEFIQAVVVHPDPRSFLIRISFESTDPELSADAANAVAETFIEEVREHFQQRTSLASSAFARQQETLQRKVDDAQQAIADFRTSSKVADVRAELARVDTWLASAAVRIEAQEFALIPLKRSRDDVRAAREAGDLSVVRRVSQDGGYLSLQFRVRDADAARLVELQEFAEDSPQVQRWDRTIESLQAQADELATAIADEIEMSYQNAVRALEKLRETSGQRTDERQRLRDLDIELTNLEEARDRAVRDLADLRAQVSALQGASGFTTTPAMMWERARPEYEPVRPKPLRDLAIAGFAALGLALGVGLLLGQLDDRISGLEEVTRGTGLPVLGLLPLVVGEPGEADSASLETPDSDMAEAIRIIRTGIFNSRTGPRPRIILVTSPEKGEGKTMTAVNLAVSIAQSGTRTLLIDCDLRNPRVHQVFGLDNTRGLSQVFANGLAMPPAVRPSEKAALLEVTTTGPRPPHPGELMGGERMQAFLKHVSEEYDRIVIDAPPAGPVADPSTLAPHVDAVILVVEMGNTRMSALKRAHEHLTAVRAPILGVVLNKTRTKPGYYGYDS